MYSLVWVAGILRLHEVIVRGGRGICFVLLLGLVVH